MHFCLFSKMLPKIFKMYRARIFMVLNTGGQTCTQNFENLAFIYIAGNRILKASTIFALSGRYSFIASDY